MTSDPDFNVATFLSRISEKRRVLKRQLLFHANRKLCLTYGMVLCLVTLTDLQTRRSGLSASAELLVNCIAGSAAAIAIVPATPVGKWENPVVSLGTAGLDPSVAVVAPSVGEKTEVPDGSVDVAEPLVSSTSSILGSSTIDNKLRLTASVENAAAAIAVAKVMPLVFPHINFLHLDF